MTRYDVFMIGSSHGLKLEVAEDDMEALLSTICSKRFLAGRIVPDEHCSDYRPVIVAVSRIAMICEETD